MKNIASIQLANLYKGIATCQSRINKGLSGKKLVYAERYIKGAKTKISKILKNLKKFEKSYKFVLKNKYMKKIEIFKKVKEVANKIVKAIKVAMDKLIKSQKNLENCVINKGVDKKMEKNKKMVLPKDFMIKIANIDLDDEEIFNSEMDLSDKYSEWHE